jgi:hypothetical protein
MSEAITRPDPHVELVRLDAFGSTEPLTADQTGIEWLELDLSNKRVCADDEDMGKRRRG